MGPRSAVGERDSGIGGLRIRCFGRIIGLTFMHIAQSAVTLGRALRDQDNAQGELKMPSGPGRYEAAATLVREMTGAACVVVIVLGGRNGDGFDQQIDTSRVASMSKLKRLLIYTLRMVADTIEGDMPEGDGDKN